MTGQNNEAAEAVASEEKPQIQFNMQRVYIKDISFETPQGVAAFKKEWKPAINQEMATKTKQLEEGVFEVTLHLTVTVKTDEEVLYLVEIQQAGIFTVSGLKGQQLAHVLNAACPNMLFPYAREAIDGIVTKGSFPALMLPPINFDALFVQAVQQAQTEHQAKAAESDEVTH